MQDINLYCNCHKEKFNKRTEYSQKNLMLGSIFYEPSVKTFLFQKGFIFDDTGDNISHLNSFFGQLTGLYWIWKNSFEDIIGVNTYRLFWGDYFLKNDFKSNTLYIPEGVNVNLCVRGEAKENSNVHYHYSYCHGESGLNLLYDLSQKSNIAIKPYMIDDLKNQYLLHPFNMFISERKTFDKICNILFDVLLEYYFLYKPHFKKIEEERNQNRILDFLGERVLHIIYTNKDYFIPNIDIETIQVINIDHNF